MASIRVSDLNLETPVTSETGEVIKNDAESTQVIQENITTACSVVVTCINFEFPVTGAHAPHVKPAFAGDGVSAFVGAAAITRETLVSIARSIQSTEESLIETIVTYATSMQQIDTLVHQKLVDSIVSTPPVIPKSEQVIFENVRSRSDAIVTEQPEMSKEKIRQKEEDELILLGVLG